MASTRGSRPLIDVARLRAWHAYIGMFIAPMIVFFSLSGCLQIFDFHEAHAGYTPPPLLSALGRLHKDQVFAPVAPRKPKVQAPGGPGAAGVAEHAEDGPPLKTTLLKYLFFTEGLAVAATTLVGVIIGLKHAKRAKTSAIVLGAGIVVPLFLIFV
jgi:hypothetical protein